MQIINLKKEDKVKLAQELRERREILEQVQNPVFCGDCPSEVL